MGSAIGALTGLLTLAAAVVFFLIVTLAVLAAGALVEARFFLAGDAAGSGAAGSGSFLLEAATGLGAGSTAVFLAFAGGSEAATVFFAGVFVAFGFNSGAEINSISSVAAFFLPADAVAATALFSVFFGTSGLPVSSYSRAVFAASGGASSVAGVESGVVSEAPDSTEF